MASLVRARQVWERRRAEQWREFETAYADATLDRWNKLELFGIDVPPGVQRRQKLTVAYIALNLQTESDHGSGTGLASVEELLTTAARERRPPVILGEAGGGKTGASLSCSQSRSSASGMVPSALGRRAG